VPENSNNKWTPEEDARLKFQYVHSSHRSEVEEVGPSHKGPRSGTEPIDETGTGRAQGEEMTEAARKTC
jgi:hypothetical protein